MLLKESYKIRYSQSADERQPAFTNCTIHIVPFVQESVMVYLFHICQCFSVGSHLNESCYIHW